MRKPLAGDAVKEAEGLDLASAAADDDALPGGDATVGLA